MKHVWKLVIAKYRDLSVQHKSISSPLTNNDILQQPSSITAYCLICLFFSQSKPQFMDHVRRLEQSQRELLESSPTTFQASGKLFLSCFLFRLIITGTKTGGMLSCTLETKGPTIISTMICIMTQSPLEQMVGMTDPSVPV